MKTLKSILFLLCLLFAAQVYAGDKTSFLKKQFTTSNGYQLNYRVLYPENYCPDQKYPVLLFMHGAGERGSDNEKQLFHGGDTFASYENQSKYPAIIIAPQCPEDSYWVEFISPKTNDNWFARTYPLNPTMTKPLAAVKELLDSYIAKGIVDTKRIYVFGLSMGGMATYELLCRYPNLFAAATPICGAVNMDRLAKYRGKAPVRLYHGAADNVISVEYSQKAYDLLKKNGIEVTYKEYPGVDHNSWTPAFAEPDFFSWMFEHKLP